MTANGKIGQGIMMKICNGGGHVMASTALTIGGELKKGKTIFRVRIWIEAIGSTPERWLDDFPEGFTHYWDFDNLRDAINFQRNFSKKWGLPDPLDD